MLMPLLTRRRLLAGAAGLPLFATQQARPQPLKPAPAMRGLGDVPPDLSSR